MAWSNEIRRDESHCGVGMGVVFVEKMLLGGMGAI